MARKFLEVFFFSEAYKSSDLQPLLVTSFGFLSPGGLLFQWREGERNDFYLFCWGGRLCLLRHKGKKSCLRAFNTDVGAFALSSHSVRSFFLSFFRFVPLISCFFFFLPFFPFLPFFLSFFLPSSFWFISSHWIEVIPYSKYLPVFKYQLSADWV